MCSAQGCQGSAQAARTPASCTSQLAGCVQSLAATAEVPHSAMARACNAPAGMEAPVSRTGVAKSIFTVMEQRREVSKGTRVERVGILAANSLVTAARVSQTLTQLLLHLHLAWSCSTSARRAARSGIRASVPLACALTSSIRWMLFSWCVCAAMAAATGRCMILCRSPPSKGPPCARTRHSIPSLNNLTSRIRCCACQCYTLVCYPML